MKKIFIIFFTILYSVMASGFTHYSHWCKETGIISHSFSNSLEEQKDKPCPICAAKEKGLNEPKKDCCKHDTKIVKVDNSVKKQSHFDFSVKFWGDAIPNKMLGTLFDFRAVETETPKSLLYTSTKIPIRDNPLYILHCVYRI